MAKKKANGESKNKSLESWIWDAACSIRGAKDAPKCKDYILPLIFTKRLCDVFDDELDRIAVAYRHNGVEETDAPVGADAYASAEPVYIDLPGWKASTVGITIGMISTGPDRDHTIIRKHPFD